MDKLISLLKIDFINTLNLSNLKSKENKRRMFVFGFLILLLIPNYRFLIQGLDSSFETYREIGQEADFLKQAIINVQLISLIFGVPYILNKYYYSRDIDYLLPLPIKSSHIVGSKFIMIAIYNLIIALPLFLPYLFIYARHMDPGGLYILYSLINFSLITIFPASIVSIFVMTMMKYTNIGSKKDLLRNLFSFLFILAMLFIQFKIQDLVRLEADAGGDILNSVVIATSQVINKIDIIFPMSIFASRALINSSSLVGLLNMGLVLGFNLLTYMLALKISDKVYVSGYVSIGEIQSRKKKNLSEMKSKIKQNSKWISIMKKELIMIMKTPIYLLNIVGGVIIVPLLLLVTLYAEGEMLVSILGMHSEDSILFSIYASLFISFLNISSSGLTSFSREGKSMWINRVLPIDERSQIIGRLMAALSLIIVANVIISSLLAFLIPIRALEILLILVLSLVISIPMILLGMLVDIIRPVLDWDDPQKAVKQNMNVLISMISISIHLLILTFVIFSLGGNHQAIIYFIIGLSIFLTYLLGRGLSGKIRDQIQNL